MDISVFLRGTPQVQPVATAQETDAISLSLRQHYNVQLWNSILQIPLARNRVAARGGLAGLVDNKDIYVVVRYVTGEI